MKVYWLPCGTTLKGGSNPFVKFCEILRTWKSLSVLIRKPWLQKNTEGMNIWYFFGSLQTDIALLSFEQTSGKDTPCTLQKQEEKKEK